MDSCSVKKRKGRGRERSRQWLIVACSPSAVSGIFSILHPLRKKKLLTVTKYVCEDWDVDVCSFTPKKPLRSDRERLSKTQGSPEEAFSSKGKCCVMSSSPDSAFACQTRGIYAFFLDWHSVLNSSSKESNAFGEEKALLMNHASRGLFQLWTCSSRCFDLSGERQMRRKVESERRTTSLD